MFTDIKVCCAYVLLMVSNLTLALPKSNFVRKTGHYPPIWCEVSSNIWYKDENFHAYQDDSSHQCGGTTMDVWPMILHDEEQKVECVTHFDIGYTFPIYYWASGSNYYHMHYDTLIPLFAELYHKKNNSNLKLSLMPVVESRRLQRIDLNTKAFQDRNKWWMQLLETIAGEHTLLPLGIDTKSKNICFDRLYLGAPGYNKTDSEMVKGFVAFIKQQLDIPDQKPRENRLILISRRGRRKLLNEEAMLDAVKDLVPGDRVDFAGMSFKEQVRSMQRYSILVGMNGAGFMNALYLPAAAVAVQLAPYNNTLNVDQFSQLIKNRGPYLEWYNTHPENHHVKGGTHNADTRVHLGEFRELIQRALAIVNGNQRASDEL